MSGHDESKSRQPRYWIAGIVIVAVLLAVTATAMWVARGIGSAEQTTESAAYDDITELVIDTKAGDVDITAVESDEVKVDSISHWRGGNKPESSQRVDDGALRIGHDGCGGVALECWVEYRIEMPADTAIDIDQSGGNITTTGVSGPQRLKVSAGDVNFEEATGDLTVESSAGNVTGERLESEKVDIQQSAGDSVLAFTGVPGNVKSTTDAGNIEVTVPGSQSYAVDADSGAGDLEVTAPEKKSSDHEITAHTSAGNVTVRDSQD